MDGRTQSQDGSSEELLAQRAAEGDEEAYGALYCRLWAWSVAVAAACIRWLGLSYGADDLAQDAWCNVLRSQSYEYPRPLRPWLRQIIRRTAISRARAEYRRERRTAVPEVPGSVDVERQVEAREILSAVEEIMADLPPRLQIGLQSSVADVQSTDVPGGTLRGWRRDARARVRAELRRRGLL